MFKNMGTFPAFSQCTMGLGAAPSPPLSPQPFPNTQLNALSLIPFCRLLKAARHANIQENITSQTTQINKEGF